MKKPADVINRILKENGWSQTELADKADLYAHHISELISPKGKRTQDRTTFATLEKIAKACGESVAIFSDFQEESSPRSIPAEFPADLQEVMPMLIKIMGAEDKNTKEALKANVRTFYKTIQYQEHIKEQDAKIEGMQGEINELKKIVADLQEHIATDFKTQRKRSGSSG